VDPDRLQLVITGELARRRADVMAIDPRLAGMVDLLIGFVSAGGKRLRPEFLWCGWIAGGGTSGDGGNLDGHHGRYRSGDPETPVTAVLTVAAALELIQACALVHDDVIDRSERRRGSPSTHRAMAKVHADAGLAGDSEHFGVSAAVLLGDLALVWADDLYTTGAEALGAVQRSSSTWRAMRTEVLSGQLLDLLATADIGSGPAAQAADAMQVNRFKTAAYTVERPLELGAALAGAPAGTIAALRSFGADVGVAFQLRDDLLGVYGDPSVTGKPAGDDLLEGKRTLLLATARGALGDDPALLAELDAGIGTSGADPVRLAALIADTGAPDLVEQRISELVGSGLAALAAVDEAGRPVINAAARARLTELAHAATARRS
jgi:geranylgeranyl diphosphate synthase type I